MFGETERAFEQSFPFVDAGLLVSAEFLDTSEVWMCPLLILPQNATQGPYLYPLGVVAAFRVQNGHQKVIFRRTTD